MSSITWPIRPSLKFVTLAGLAGLALGLTPTLALAQAPATSPSILTTAASARSTALAGAWVAGRDSDVIFTNPAQLIGARSDFAATYSHPTSDVDGATLSSVYAGGKWQFTLGWGLQAVTTTDVAAHSAVAVVGGAVQYKNWKLGASLKRVDESSAALLSKGNGAAFLTDVGAAHGLWGGTVAVAMQNIGAAQIDGLASPTPRQIAGGWSRGTSAGPLDLTLFTQASHRRDWNGAAAGLEASYSWIEGMSITGRVGVRRPERSDERPVTLGGALSADRLTIEYGVQFYTNNQTHVVTVRWR